MIELDASQQEFCRSTSRNIRLLAPAGCGKTISLLYRCRDLAARSKGNPRFRIVTFTNVAAEELKERIRRDESLETVRNFISVSTLNAYGWRTIQNEAGRNKMPAPRLIKTSYDKQSTISHHLQPIWKTNKFVKRAVERGFIARRELLEVIDALKSLGFDHTRDLNRDSVYCKLDYLESRGLGWRVTQQFQTLTRIGVLEKPKTRNGSQIFSRRAFYDRFFTFWRRATEHLQQHSFYTFEDQKYWAYLTLGQVSADGKRKRLPRGITRYDHILVDEFQDINPLDLALVNAIRTHHRANLVIVGDDDQAIFEWRGASPDFILNPEVYFGDSTFVTKKLRTNYRSPKQIVELSQNLIKNNRNRVRKTVLPVPTADDARIEVRQLDSIGDRLNLVTDLVRGTDPGKVAVIGRLRRQLIPFQIHYASNGAPFKTASDLDVYSGDAFNKLVSLLEIWDRARDRRRMPQTVGDAISICNVIKQAPLRKNTDQRNLRSYLMDQRPRTTVECVTSLETYDGPDLSGKSHAQLHASANRFIKAESVHDAIMSMSTGFDGLRWDPEHAEDDIWYTNPPFEMLAELAMSENFDAFDLIERIENVKDSLEAFRRIEDESESDADASMLERPLHLMTAHRSKGKEFDTVVMLDVDEDHWPGQYQNERELEAARRLFYVAFTRAQKKVIMLHEKDEPLSRFVEELGDKELIRSVA